MNKEGDVLDMDDKFYYGVTPRNSCVDMTKLDYRLPTTIEKYMKLHGTGFNALAWEVIELFEHRTSNNDFKRQLKRLHAEHKKNNKI